MLDTVALTLDRHEFDVLEPDRFSPSARGLLIPPYYPLGARGVFICVQNPTKTDFEEGRYGPRLTLVKRKIREGFGLTLRIEFSAPKLLFGNNFDELRSRDLEAVLRALLKSLRDAGIRTTEDTLRAARVSTIHYSKNMLLTDFTSCSMVLSELERIDLDARLDLSRTDYRNDGHVIRYHANSYEISFYDKLKDLQKAHISEKRAIERDNAVQFDLLTKPCRFPKGIEVLRFEVRLGNRTKINDVMKRLGAEVEPTFAALFDISVAKQVLGYFWSRIQSAVPPAGRTAKERPEEMLARFAASSSGEARPGKLLQQVGGAILLDSVGIRGLGALMKRHGTSRSWQRMKRELKSLPPSAPNGFSGLLQVDEALKEFRALSLQSFQTSPTQGSVTRKALKMPAKPRRRAASSRRGRP